ncbi:hypothetical protein AB6D30_15015 [Pectobacterium brasiliense]|uniref:Uncharacterized protein n=1 Tax=Pectobacterium parvum TaxID=2778550 RepID=A0AAP9IIL5_9GAMM|nr:MULTISPECIES: hypothetical protein [Pectobacterium]APS30443.1 hypothetical protein NC16_12215 [Pectobacterium brasiliense]ARA76113.1 hypothetical protein B5S52_09605 [Pectobacterium brasiliense]KHS75968.1 hypothetical protein RC79_05050 [Pectobacterium brasiliense]KHS89392.1 hypothetical protein RC83_05740 [Pectobacterium brasiliense]KHT00386.1 hypothetical protein RC90_06380 [Pectobacterium brasiliense]
MNNTAITLRHTSTMIIRLLVWVWLGVLTALAVLNYRATANLVKREQVDASLQQIQVLEGRLTELADNIQALEARPVPASATALRSMQQSLETRIAQMEQKQENYASTQVVQTLRDELVQLKSQQKAAIQSAPTTSRTTNPAATAPRKMPFPFRILGLELRAGQRMVSIAPASGEPAPEQIQLVLPDETVSQWRLETIDGDTAIFSRAGQTRRLAIP